MQGRETEPPGAVRTLVFAERKRYDYSMETNQMANLSPAAQAVRVVFKTNQVVSIDGDSLPALAAALRALADLVVPDIDLHISVANDCLPRDIGAAKWSARYETRRELLAIATELEGSI
jgi:hypothetical protein